MGIFSTLKQTNRFDNTTSDTSNPRNNGRYLDKCLVRIQIRKSEFNILSKFYYYGYTSYRSYLRYVFVANKEKIREVIQKAGEKASSGCVIDDTYVLFYFDDTHFIIIPFEVFSDTENMTGALRNTKVWNRDNIARILKLFPEFEEDASMIRENDILNLFAGE